MAAAGMDGLFDHVLSVTRSSATRPHPRLTGLVPDRLGCRASEILFVSSNGWDVAVPPGFGYTTFWINRLGFPASALGDAHGGRSIDG